MSKEALLPQKATDDLKARITLYHGSMEKLAGYIRDTLKVSITLNTIGQIVNGKQSTSLERYRALAQALHYHSIEEAFPPNTDQNNGKENGTSERLEE
jgi:hypothetical protein